MNTLPFVIDNQQCRMSDILNILLIQYRGQSVDIVTTHFTLEGWQLLADNIGNMGNVRLLLGSEPVGAMCIGRPEIAPWPISFSPTDFDEKILRLIEDLTALLCEKTIQVRLYAQGFLHANCYLFYRDGGFELFNSAIAIIGSSNFTHAGLFTNKELNLVYRANLVEEDISLERLRGLLEKNERLHLKQLAAIDRMIAANIPGVLAINELSEWYEHQWEVACDFKQKLMDLLAAFKVGTYSNITEKSISLPTKICSSRGAYFHQSDQTLLRIIYYTSTRQHDR